MGKVSVRNYELKRSKTVSDEAKKRCTKSENSPKNEESTLRSCECQCYHCGVKQCKLLLEICAGCESILCHECMYERCEFCEGYICYSCRPIMFCSGWIGIRHPCKKKCQR